MALIPRPRPLTEILKTLRQTFITKSGVNDIFKGSSVNSFLEAAALSDFRSQSDIIAALNSVNIDRAEGVDLDNIGKAKNVGRTQARPATGSVTLRSVNFTKISTKIYAGTAAPPIGQSTINVSDASSFPATGSVYLGRGSNNIEGPIAYSSITPIGNYYQINLSSPTTKNHNVNESIVLAQGGNRVVSIGTVVQTEANATSPAVSFRTLATVTIPDGESSLDSVPVVCTEIGTRGNVPANSITSFPSAPFPGAGVTNPVDFITGKDTMSDVDYRLKIKNAEQTKSKGTPLAVETASVDVTSPDDNKTSTSAKLSQPSNRSEPATLYIDDGTAYQPIYKGQGFEQIVDNANGGEKYLQLQNEDLTKALVLSSFTAPFALTGDMKLSIIVGGVLSEHTFADDDFATQNAADTFEVVNSINANTDLLFSARAVNNSKQLIIFAKNFENEDIQITSSLNDVNANDYLGLGENLTYSLRLYKNDELLIKDGSIPTLFSITQSLWPAISSGDTIVLKVDKSQYITYTFVDSDFIPFGFATVSQNNSLSAWASVINNKMAGVTATVEGSQLKFTSNKGASDDAAIYIDSSSTLASKMFGFSTGTLSDLGAASDYHLNRATGQIELNDVLAAGDVITAGSRNTRAFVDSLEISTGSVTLAASSGTSAGPKLWVVVDSPAEFIQSTADASSQITISNPSTNVWRFLSSVATAFSNVQVGDWVVISDDAIHTHNPNFIGAWRVSAVSGNYFEFYMTNSLGSTGGPFSLLSSDTITFIRSEGSIQEIDLLTGLQTLTAIASAMNSQLQGAFASAVNGKTLRITSNSYSLLGFVMLAGMTPATGPLGFTVGSSDSSTVTHSAFAESGMSEVTMPTFVHDEIATGTSTIPPINLTTTTDVSEFVNSWISFLNPFGHSSSNKNLYAMSADITGTALTLRAQDKLRDVLSGDRYFPAFPFNFEPLDNLVVILDNDSINKSLNIRMGRKGTVSGVQVPTQSQFKAYDSDAGPTASYANQFGNNFDFKDFFLYFNARQILDPSGVNNKMLIRSTKFGPTGEQVKFGIAYPTTPASDMTSVVDVDTKTNIKVYLASGPERLGGAWDSTTQFDVTNVAPSMWRYNWNGIGTAPIFVTGATVAVGDIVNISGPFDPDNGGIFRVSAVTDNYFEIKNPDGVTETTIQLTTGTNYRFYSLDASANKASDVEAHVATLSYISIDQLENGSGVITTSTYDDTGSEYVSLVDGFNAVSLSNVGTTISPQNQFNLKVALSILESDPDYTLVGEEFYLVPATAEQIARFLNIFAVTGLSSLGNISVSSGGGKVQIYSSLFGSSGSILVSGGSANSAEGALLSTGSEVSQAEISPQVSGLRRSGSNVIASTLDRHGLQVGDEVIISGASNSTFDGTFTVSAVTARTFTYSQAQPTLSIDVSGAVRVSNTVTIITTSNHSLAVGDEVTISGVTNATFNGTFIVTNTPSAQTFTYAQAAVDASSGNGSVTNVASGNGLVLRPYTKTTINVANEAGFQAGQWVKVQNTAAQSKITGMDATTNLQITTFNTLTLSGSGSFQTVRTHSGTNTTQFKVEKQAQFLVISWTGVGVNPNFVNVEEGDWVRISGNFASVNQGIFKIEKKYNNSIYLINETGIEEEVTMSAATDLRFYSYDSIMPGDQLVIGDSILGTLNVGTYTVADSPFPSATQLTVSTNFAANFGPVPLGTSLSQVQLREENPYFAYRKILNITPDPANPNALLVIFDGDVLPSKMNISAGSYMASIGKMAFPTTVQSGEDSYKYWQGLIHEVGRVIRGQADDPIGYPGIAASGSYIEIDAPLPKRIQVSVVVRVRTGIPFNTIKSRVQSSVAAYVNSLGVGLPVIFSEIVSAVQEINGVQAVSIASPTYNSTNDQIVSQYNEKPVIVNVAEDVIISLAT